MPLPIPNLDDRTFADLVAEGRAMIPRLAPQWTNHNPSDPGITLLELLAFATESVLYDVNQVRDESYRAFLSLIGCEPLPGENLDAAIVRAVRSLQTRTRAASAEDFEHLAVDRSEGAAARARVIADRNLEGTLLSEEAHVSLVVLPAAATVGLADAPNARTFAVLQAAMSDPAASVILKGLKTSLEPMLLITTDLHVVAPEFVSVDLRVSLSGRFDASPAGLANDAEAALRRFLDPYEGGEQSTGWPFGRAVYKSELLQLLEAVPGVDHVDELMVNDDPTQGPVRLAADQLPCAGNVTIAMRLEDRP
jgi:hypothetical protein